MIKACAYCKRKYKAERKERTFCSRACRNKAYPLNQKHKRTGKEQGCPVCGKVFYVPGHMLKPVNYCSRSCASRARRGDLNPNFRNGQNVKVDKICETCGQRSSDMLDESIVAQLVLRRVIVSNLREKYPDAAISAVKNSGFFHRA